jgi:hypothetical protein
MFIATLIVLLAIVLWLRSDSTIYAPGYSWGKFSSIRNGMTSEEVTRILGPPLSIETFGGSRHWSYPTEADIPNQANSNHVRTTPDSSAGLNLVADMSGKILRADRDWPEPGTEKMVGKSLDDIRKLYGSPPIDYTIPRHTLYWYTKMRGIKGEYVMNVHFDANGKVYQIDAGRIGHYIGTPGQMPQPSGWLEWLEWNLP